MRACMCLWHMYGFLCICGSACALCHDEDERYVCVHVCVCGICVTLCLYVEALVSPCHNEDDEICMRVCMCLWQMCDILYVCLFACM